jgi:D-3-phosphoglycerate dehydrogenase
MPHVVLFEAIHESATRIFQDAGFEVRRHAGALSGDALLKAIEGASAIGIRSATHLVPEVFAAAPALRTVGCFCIGTSQVALDAAAHRGVPVFNAPFSNTRSVAEMVIAQAVLLLRRIPEKSQLAHAGKWAKTAKGAFEARGKTLAIVGYGNIGSQVGILAEALGMQVRYYDVQPKLPLGTAVAAATLHQVLEAADVVTLHVPLEKSTEGLIGLDQLQHMKRGAILINASRGTVVDIDALAALIESGHIGGAAIDVFPREPKSNEDEFVSPLRGLPNVMLTPHIGGSTQEAQQNIGTEVATKLVRFLAMGATQGAVNFPEVRPDGWTGCCRILNVHRNEPGALARINSLIAGSGANILSQSLHTKGDLGYVVTDLEQAPSAQLLNDLSSESHFIRTDILRPIST